MGQVQVVYPPDRPIVRVGTSSLALAEEHQLETVAPVLSALDVAGVVPPLGPEIRMIEVVARKFEAVSRDGLAKAEVGLGSEQ